MALLIVLLVVTLLAALLTEFAFSTLVDLRLTETFRDRTRAYYLAKGGVGFGRAILREDGNGYDARTELWGQGMAGYPVGDGMVFVEITDLGGRLDLNRLVTPQGNIDVLFKGRLLRLLKGFGAADPESLTDALIDWLDPDDKPEARGAEQDHYLRLAEPYVCKNGPLDSVAELAMVDGFTPELLRRLEEHVTVHGDARVNVNTASAELLAVLVEEMDDSAAAAIVERREAEPIESVEELRSLPGFDTVYWAVNSHLAVTSPTYRIRSQAEVNDGARTVEAVVAKEGDRLLYLEVR